MPERDWEKDWEMCEKATPGPWVADGKELWHRGKSYDDPDDPHVYLGGVADWCEQCKANLHLIAEAREALPYYLRRVKELEAQVEWCRWVEECPKSHKNAQRVKKLEAVAKAAEGVKMCFQWCHSECFPFNEQGCPYHKSDKCWLAELFKALDTLEKEE